jgi:23S rRNA pseudouridine2457 synthase
VGHDGAVLLAFHKPYGVLSQFTPDGSSNRTLAEFKFPPAVYSLGRLDADSEGLLLLSDEPGLNTKLLSPKHQHSRTYWVQVEGIPGHQSIELLAKGIVIQGRRTKPAFARPIAVPDIPPRTPPIRFRKNVPDSWLELQLVEGRNRQVRRMTAAAGHPTLRLIRVRIGGFHLNGLASGKWKILGAAERQLVFSISNREPEGLPPRSETPKSASVRPPSESK